MSPIYSSNKVFYVSINFLNIHFTVGERQVKIFMEYSGIYFQIFSP